MTAALAAEREALGALAARYRVEPSYLDGLDVERHASPESLVAILRALGAPIERPGQAEEALRAVDSDVRPLLDAVYVAWTEDPPRPRRGLRLEVPSERAGEGALSWTVELESGGVIEGRGAISRSDSGAAFLEIPDEIPPGYHRVHAEGESERAEALLLCAPRRAYGLAAAGGDGSRARRTHWGVFLPLHALRTERDWGAGDLADLGALCSWAGGLGASAVGTLPLFAVDVEHLREPSPYSPLSRLFWSELWLAVDRLPEARSPEPRRLLEQEGFRVELAELRDAGAVDYHRLVAVKRRALELLADAFWSDTTSRRAALDEYLGRRPEAESFAAFRAVADGLGGSWHGWPERMRAGQLDGGDYLERNRRYHLYCQMALDEQLQEVLAGDGRRDVGLYLDLPVGSHAASYDVWRHRHLFAGELAVGAPPDALFRGGQNWALPPPHPEAQRRGGYDYWIAVLRTLFARASVIRLDHVMGLHRLFCVPAGARAADGAYVRYPADELYAIVSLESHRARAEVVGEDLGTVPAEVRDSMRRHGLHRLWVLQYELGQVEEAEPSACGAVHDDAGVDLLAGSGSEHRVVPEPPVESLACLDTHDMPPFAAFLEGSDLETWRRLGLMGDEEAARELERRGRLRSALAGRASRPARDHVPPEASVREVRPQEEQQAPEEELRRALRRTLHGLAASRASWLSINLEDLWLETAPQNVPGTGEEEGNWRRRARRTLEDMRGDPSIEALLREVDARRREEAR